MKVDVPFTVDSILKIIDDVLECYQTDDKRTFRYYVKVALERARKTVEKCDDVDSAIGMLYKETTLYWTSIENGKKWVAFNVIWQLWDTVKNHKYESEKWGVIDALIE